MHDHEVELLSWNHRASSSEWRKNRVLIGVVGSIGADGSSSEGCGGEFIGAVGSSSDRAVDPPCGRTPRIRSPPRIQTRRQRTAVEEMLWRSWRRK